MNEMQDGRRGPGKGRPLYQGIVVANWRSPMRVAEIKAAPRRFRLSRVQWLIVAYGALVGGAVGYLASVH